MFATALIVFRETLEAALFIGIIAAATRGLLRRTQWLSLGVAAGCVGAVGVALAMARISSLGNGLGQDYLNIGIITVALLMLTWHCVWISTHSRETAREAKQMGLAAKDGSSSLWALSIAVALAVLREGSETVVFVYGFMSGSAQGTDSMLLGVGIGLFTGAACGVLIYQGLTKIKTQHFFTVTNAWVLIMAGALAAQLARALAQSGLVQLWTEPLWDTSSALSMDSALGSIFRALVGYDARPSGLQILFYAGAITMIALATQQAKRLNQKT
jgi:high-affinity iron transporter